MLAEKLSGSKFADAAYLTDIMEEFERKTKRKFDGTQASIIRFGKDWDNDRPHGIIKGRLTLSKEDVATAFNAVIPRIVSSVSNLLDGRKVEVRGLIPLFLWCMSDGMCSICCLLVVWESRLI
jgi:hypothetical protein